LMDFHRPPPGLDNDKVAAALNPAAPCFVPGLLLGLHAMGPPAMCKPERTAVAIDSTRAAVTPQTSQGMVAVVGTRSQQARPIRQSPNTLISEASALHKMRKCQPCAHNWKPGGCVKGQACEFCHFCNENDFRMYQKKKMYYVKKARRAWLQLEQRCMPAIGMEDGQWNQ